MLLRLVVVLVVSTLASAVFAEPPPPPPLGDAGERAERLFQAIRTNDPQLAMPFFLPQDAFRAIKNAADPDRFWNRLVRLYERDIAALHASHPDLGKAEFVRLELSRRRSWVEKGEEANRLPYWSQRRNRLVYRVGNEERALEIRTLISWEGRWYVTHLSDAH